MGSQKMQAELWSVAAQDWSDYQEATLLPAFEKILHDCRQTPAHTLLDVGCGSGLFCELAAQQEYDVWGLDATPEFIAIAQRETPAGHFQTGDMEELPYPDNTFDVVTGINSFQYAANPVRALEEAHRVLRTNGKLVVAIWGKAQECQAAVYLKALGSLMPPPPPGTPGPFALSEDGALESLVRKAGFTPGPRTSVACPFVYSDLTTALNGLLSAGPARRAILHTSYEAAVEAVTNAIAPFKTRLVVIGWRIRSI